MRLSLLTGSLIAHDDVCDGTCDLYRCRDGSIVRHHPDRSPRCNGYWQCPDGSDEEGCAQIDAICM
jgi:hypothetical protein